MIERKGDVDVIEEEGVKKTSFYVLLKFLLLDLSRKEGESGLAL
jgi:hypothetical protein